MRARLLQNVLEHMQPSLRQREIHTNVEENLPMLDFDYIQMDQVPTNLIR